MNEETIQKLYSSLTKTMQGHFDSAQHSVLYKKLNELIYKIYIDRGVVFDDVRYGYEWVYYKNEKFLTPDGMQYLLQLYQDGIIKNFRIMTDKKLIILSVSPYKM